MAYNSLTKKKKRKKESNRYIYIHVHLITCVKIYHQIQFQNENKYGLPNGNCAESEIEAFVVFDLQ